MSSFYRHDRRPAWGEGRLVADEGSRLRILFADGAERALVKGAPGLVVVAQEAVAPASPANLEAPSERRRRIHETDPAMLIKSVRVAVRDAVHTAKLRGAYPDDLLVELQEGLSRITADHARFLGTRPATVHKTSAPAARELHQQLGGPALFDELANRLDATEPHSWQWTRAYEDPQSAAASLRELWGYVEGAATLDDDQLAQLARLLTPDDLKSETEE